MNEVLLSVCIITYNQKEFIQQCIDGALFQNTSFKYEIIINDDNSTDGTSAICEAAAAQNPLQITYCRNIQNLGMINNWIESIKRCKGKYIALCEGDDYWTDPNKLQKQVDFLEANPEYSICFSGFKTLDEYTHQETIKIPLPQSINIESIIEQNNYATATTVFHARYMKPVPEWFSNMVFADWPLYISVLAASNKKAYCINDVTTVYRIHAGGVHGNLHASNKKLIKAYKQHIDFYRAMQSNLFKKNYTTLIAQCIRKRKEIIASLYYKERNIVGVMLSKFY